MLFGAKFVALVAALSSVAFAAPAPEAIPEALSLEKRNCPRCEPFGGAKAVAGLYLGNANNKSNQIERLIEEVIELLVGEHPKCHKKDIHVWCDEDKEHWGWKRDEVEGEMEMVKRTDNDDKDCDKKYPYKHCHVRCKSKNYC